MAAIPDSRIFNHILSTQECNAVWSDETRTKYFVKFIGALAKAQGELDIIPQRAATCITEACADADFLDQSRVQEEIATFFCPVFEVVKQVVAKVDEIDPDARFGGFALWGATTGDVTETATIMQLRDSLDLISEEIERIMAALESVCQKYEAYPQPAHPDIAHAAPMSFGFKLARLSSFFRCHQDGLAELRRRLIVLQFSGSAATLCHLMPKKQEQYQKVLQHELDLGSPALAWHSDHDRVAEVGAFLSQLTRSCARFSEDLKSEMFDDNAEVSDDTSGDTERHDLETHQKDLVGGDSVTVTAATMRAIAIALGNGVVQDCKQSTHTNGIDWITLPQLCPWSHACLRHTAVLLETLDISEKTIRRDSDESEVSIESNDTKTQSRSYLGSEYAYDLVDGVCREAVETGKTLIDLVDNSKEIKLSNGTLEKLFDPSSYMYLGIKVKDAVMQEMAA